MVLDTFNTALSRARESTTTKVAAVVATSAIFYGVYKFLSKPKDSAVLSDVQQALVNESGGPSRVGPTSMKPVLDILSTSGATNPVHVAIGKSTQNRGNRTFALKSIYKSFLSKILPSSTGFVAVLSQNAESVAVFSPTGSVKASIPNVYDEMGICYTDFSRRGRPSVASKTFNLKRNRIISKFPSAYYIFSIGTSSSVSGPESLKTVINSISALASKNNCPTLVEVSDPTLLPTFEALGFIVIEEFSLFDVKISILKK